MHFVWHFCSYLLQFELLNFPRQCSNIGMVWWEILNICVANFMSFLARKNFKNRLRFDKVADSLKVRTFFETQCISICCQN